MQYIVLDMEWNQAWPGSSAARAMPGLHGEIIQIGAVRLLEDQTVADEFQILVRLCVAVCQHMEANDFPRDLLNHPLLSALPDSAAGQGCRYH